MLFSVMISGDLSSNNNDSGSSNKDASKLNSKTRSGEDAAEVWKKSVVVLKEKLDPQIFAAWIKPLSVGRLEISEKRTLNGPKKALELFAPNKFCCEHVKNHYEKVISSAIGDTLGEGPVTLKFKVGNIYIEKPVVTNTKGAATNTGNSVSAKDNLAVKALVAKSSSTKAPKTTETKRKKSYGRGGAEQTNLNPKSNFSNFVIGACNQFAHAVSLRVSENLGGHYNPLFIYGGVGLGKTHLANAIGNAAHRRGAKVLLVSSEYFLNELISCVRSNRMDQFKKRFRSLDLLIIDDIQFLTGKERTQEEFFHTFNELHQRRKQIVITSDKMPQDLVGLEERLRTRFASGLSCDLQAPDFETRVAILIKKAETSGISLSSEIAGFLAERIETNVRELEGALNRVQALSSLHNIPISKELAEEVLRSFSAHMLREITPELIKKVVAERYNVSVNDLLGKRRTQNIAFARHVAMHLCRSMTGCSYPEIGALFGGRDHSTVIHANRVIDERRSVDAEVNADIEKLIKKIKG